MLIIFDDCNDFNNSENKLMYNILTRIMDILLALSGLIISIPFLIIIIAIIKLDSKGPCLYSQWRIGENGKCFRIYKLRSMYINSEKDNIPELAYVDDPRITKAGKFLRKFKIDEIPQLINILTGSMSIVGPRPERPFYTLRYYNENPRFVERLRVKPGLTGWAQINGGYDIDPIQKLNYDLYYIEHRSVFFDIRIIVKTIWRIISGKFLQ